MAAGTLVSRLSGAARDIAIAHFFAVALTDLFYVAFTIPNALRALLAEGAASSAFVPVFAQVRDLEGRSRAVAFYRRLSFVMMAILVLVSVVGVLAARPLVHAYAHGFTRSVERFETTILLVQIVFPYIALMGIGALGLGVLNAERSFAAGAFAPIAANLPLIVAPVLFVPVALWLGFPAIASLAIAALVGGVLQVLVQIPALRSRGLSIVPLVRGAFTDPYVKRALVLLGPVMIGLGVYQLNVIIGRNLASQLAPGSPSYLYYGQRIVDIPQGVFALAVGTATLPTLSSLRAQGKTGEYDDTVSYALRLAFFIGVPATVFIGLLAEPIVVVMLGRGAYQPADVVATGYSLAAQALGLWAVAAIRVTIPVFYSSNDTKSPVLGGVVNLCAYAITAFALMRVWGHVGLALASSIASVSQFLMLAVLMRRRAAIGWGRISKSVVRTILACVPMAAVCVATARLVSAERGGNDLANVGLLASGAVLAGGAFVTAALALRNDELRTVLDIVRRRAKRRPQA